MGACHITLAHVAWALAREWALSIRTAKAVTWALTREWVLARDTTVWLRKQTSPSGCALVIGLFTAIIPGQPVDNYYILQFEAGTERPL